jgi:hypothetical protein
MDAITRETMTFAARCAALRLLSDKKRPRTAQFLPHADGGWHSRVVREHEQAIPAIAAQLGISPLEYARATQAWLRREVALADVRIRMREHDFDAFIRTGRYQTLFDAGLSGGAPHIARRIFLEHTLLGVPPSCRNVDRPIYGYVTGSNESGQVAQYGEVVITMRRNVRLRSTFVCADSLDHCNRGDFVRPMFEPSPVTRPTPLSAVSRRNQPADRENAC